MLHTDADREVFDRHHFEGLKKSINVFKSFAVRYHLRKEKMRSSKTFLLRLLEIGIKGDKVYSFVDRDPQFHMEIDILIS